MPVHKNLKFDFNEAVAEARRDYPAETARTTFFRLPAFFWRRRVRQWVAEVNGAPQPKLAAEIIKDIERNKSALTSTIVKDGQTFTLITMETSKPRFNDVLHSLSFLFNHELGHVVAPNGLPAGVRDPVTREHERTADIFGLLRGVKQGSLSARDGFILASDRAFERKTLAANDPHDSADVLRRVSLQMEQVNFSALTHAEIKTIAARYGAPGRGP